MEVTWRSAHVVTRARAIAAVALGGLMITTATAASAAGRTRATWLECGTEGFIASPSNPYVFRAAALLGPWGAENGTDPPAVALRAFLAERSTAPNPVPEHSYVPLRRTENHALYGHAGGRAGIDATIAMVLRDGVWAYEQSGGCSPTRVFFGEGTADFTVVGTPTPLAREVDLVVSVGVCNPKDLDAARYLRRPLVSWQPHRLLITCLISHGVAPARGLVCAGVEALVRVRLILPRTVGTRAIFNSAYYPPMRAYHVRSGPVHGRITTIVVRERTQPV
jgi:hypothetical protein